MSFRQSRKWRGARHGQQKLVHGGHNCTVHAGEEDAHPGEAAPACKDRLVPDWEVAGQQDGTGLAALLLPTLTKREASYRSAAGAAPHVGIIGWWLANRLSMTALHGHSAEMCRRAQCIRQQRDESGCQIMCKVCGGIRGETSVSKDLIMH